MILAVSSEVALQDRHADKSHAGDVRWYTWFLGKRFPKQVEDYPHCHLTEMDANQTILPHYHQVNQFLVMIGGSVTICDEPLPLVGLHYSDHHTPFGPMSSGPYGLGIWALMPKSDPGGIYSHQPDYKDRLKPSKRRSVLVGSIALSTESVLQNRSAVAMDGLLPKDTDISDGLGAFMLRMGSKMKTTGPDPKLTGGQYYMVLNGSMNYNGASYPAWSNVFLDSAETPFEVCAGSRGLEALVMNFPRMEA